MAIKLIAGLRNPGALYANTRHNVGAWFVTMLAKHYNAAFKSEKKMSSEIACFTIDDHLCYAVLPLTFMNHSGAAIQAVSQFYQIQLNDIIIAHDDLDLHIGRIKLKVGGGHGGHNGLRNIIERLNNNAFNRVRFGIGHPGHKSMVLKYVLSKINIEEKQALLSAIHKTIDIIPILITAGANIAMNEFNE